MLQENICGYRAPRLILDNWALCIALLVATISSIIVIYYSAQPLLEFESFRQTQTALTVYWMIKEGWRLGYETPVLGYPWSIPFEFPLYQTIVAFISSITNVSIDRTGRLVSFAFLLACAWPALQITRRLNWSSDVAWVFCALVWSSPFYLFYGRMFLMETAALFFALAAIPFGLDLKDSTPRWQSVLLFCVFSTLALLQKSTTGLPVIIVISIVLLVLLLGTNGRGKLSYRRLIIIGLSFLIPLTIGEIWTQYADYLRAQNYYGAITTFNAQWRYYIGSIGDRFNLSLLREIFWDRVIAQNAAGALGVVLLAAAFLNKDRKAHFVIVVCILLFILPVFMFTRVHYFLPYYQSACVIFLMAALAVATVVCLPDAVVGKQVVVPLVVLVLVGSNFLHFLTAYGGLLARNITVRNNTTLAVSDTVRRYTPEDSAILVFGLRSKGSTYPVASWSSEIAYYSQRKSFTVEKWFENRVEEDPASYLGGKPLGSMVFCGRLSQMHRKLIKKYATGDKSGIFKIKKCYVWLPDTSKIVPPLG